MRLFTSAFLANFVASGAKRGIELLHDGVHFLISKRTLHRLKDEPKRIGNPPLFLKLIELIKACKKCGRMSADHLFNVLCLGAARDPECDIARDEWIERER